MNVPSICLYATCWLIHLIIYFHLCFLSCWFIIAMGLPSTMDANEGIQLCVFDSRRGQREGQELDKILFFYPPDCPYSVQLSVIGLSGGMITFTRFVSYCASGIWISIHFPNFWFLNPCFIHLMYILAVTSLI